MVRTTRIVSVAQTAGRLLPEMIMGNSQPSFINGQVPKEFPSDKTDQSWRIYTNAGVSDMRPIQ
jgi:hypothetical protein